MLPQFNLFGITFYPYAILMGIAWAVSFLIAENLSGSKKFKLEFLGIFVSAWIGAKVLFLLSAPEFVTSRLYNSESFWLGGGFVFYGGLLGGLIFIFFRKIVLNLKWSEFNRYIPALLIGHGIGRIGCFITGCCFGIKVAGHQLPVQLFESIFVISLGVYILKNNVNNFRIYFIAYPLFRFLIEFLRADTIRGMFWFKLSTSQIVSLMILLGVGISFMRSQFLLHSQKEK